MTQTRTTPAATPIQPGMMIWADRQGFDVRMTPRLVTTVREIRGGVMITVEGYGEEINLKGRTPYLLHA